MVDTIKAGATYLTALAIIVGGFLILYLTRSEPASAELRLVVSGFIGAAIQFVFNRETQTQTARQVQASQPTITTTSGPPATATVTPLPDPLNDGP